MKILLIWPRNQRAVLSDDLSCCEPLPLEYIGGALSDNHDIKIHDMRLDPPLESLAVGEPPDLVGIGIPFTSTIKNVHQTAHEVKRLWPSIPIVVGGHHPTMSCEWMEDMPVDYVIVGEGSAPMKSLVEQLERFGKLVEPVKGLGRFKDLGHGIPKQELGSLDEVPPPDRSLLQRHRQQYFHSIYRPVSLMRFSAGCPYNCTFCSLWRLTDRRYLIKEAERIVAELNEIVNDYIYVVDDEAFIQPNRMLELANSIEAAAIHKRYHMYVRTDTALRYPDVIERWAEIGLDSVLVGAESMDEQDLLEYHKGTRVSMTHQAIQFFHSLGVKVRANFIVPPRYLEEDFIRLANMVANLEVDMPSFSVLTPLPGTVLYEETRPEFISDNPELFDCYHTLLPTRIPLERFYDSFANLLKVTASRPTPGITSQGEPSVFYFSNNGAFDRMLETIREGHLLSAERWRSEVRR